MERKPVHQRVAALLGLRVVPRERAQARLPEARLLSNQVPSEVRSLRGWSSMTRVEATGVSVPRQFAVPQGRSADCVLLTLPEEWEPW